MLLSPLIGKVVTPRFIAHLVSPIAQPIRSVLDRFLPPIGHTVTPFGDSIPFSGSLRPRTGWSFLPAINDGSFATKIVIARQVKEAAKLLIGRASAARSLLAGCGSSRTA